MPADPMRCPNPTHSGGVDYAPKGKVEPNPDFEVYAKEGETGDMGIELGCPECNTQWVVWCNGGTIAVEEL